MYDQIEAYFSRITLVTSIDYLKSCKTDCSRGNLSAEVLAELPLTAKISANSRSLPIFYGFADCPPENLQCFNFWQDMAGCIIVPYPAVG